LPQSANAPQLSYIETCAIADPIKSADKLAEHNGTNVGQSHCQAEVQAERRKHASPKDADQGEKQHTSTSRLIWGMTILEIVL
jgi:hypothetical protein